MQKDDHGAEAAAYSQYVSDDEASSVPKLPDRYADESYKLFSKVHVADPTPGEAVRIRNKLLWRILPFLCIGYHLMYVDKQTVSRPSLVLSIKVYAYHLAIARELCHFRHSQGRTPQRQSVQLVVFHLLLWLHAC